MKKITLITIALLILSSLSFGQKRIIKGQLIDYKTSKPVINKPITLFGTSLGFMSDNDGKFKIPKLKLTSVELIVQGGQLFGQTQEKNIEYYDISLRNIDLNKKNKIIDLGIIYLVDKNDSHLLNEIPCSQVNDLKYKCLLVDGADRYIEGKYVLIDYSSPSNNCLN